MKKSILLAAVLMALVSLCLVFASCDSGSSDSVSTIAVEGVSLDSETLTLKTGTDGTLTATVLPENATDKSVTWSSDNEAVATVDQNGKVTGEAAGTATITVKTNDGAKIATCVVTVSANTHTVSFNANGGEGTMDSGSVVEGETYTIPENKFTEPAGTLRSFAGWNTKADGSGTAYAAGATIESVTANITLYAQWTKPSFSVSATEKVYFSKGNLWYGKVVDTAAEATWNFESSQYETTPTAGGPWSTSHVSHFYWSKTASVAYAQNYSDGSAATSDVFFTNATEETPNDGFTVGGVTGKYRALSKDEWDYLFNTRTSSKVGETENTRYAEVVVNNVKGMIIFPDVFTWTSDMGTAPTTINTSCSNYGAGSYDTTQFGKMQEAGVVFLPAAGYRHGEDGGGHVSNVGNFGSYWSSTPDEGVQSNAYDLCFLDSNVDPADNYYRYCGFSVRLVCAEK